MTGGGGELLQPPVVMSARHIKDETQLHDWQWPTPGVLGEFVMCIASYGAYSIANRCCCLTVCLQWSSRPSKWCISVVSSPPAAAVSALMHCLPVCGCVCVLRLQVLRDITYSGNAAMEPCAVVSRIAPTFIRCAGGGGQEGGCCHTGQVARLKKREPSHQDNSQRPETVVNWKRAPGEEVASVLIPSHEAQSAAQRVTAGSITITAAV
jgi:hypothetical protein